MCTFCIQSHKDQFLKVHIFSIARRTFHFLIRGWTRCWVPGRHRMVGDMLGVTLVPVAVCVL